MLYISPWREDSWAVVDMACKCKMRIHARTKIHTHLRDVYVTMINRQYVVLYTKAIRGIERLRLPTANILPVVYVPV